MNNTDLLNKAADNIRILAASMVEKAKSGHPGGAMGGADYVNLLFSEFPGVRSEKPEMGRTRPFLSGSGTHVAHVVCTAGLGR